MRPRLLLRPTTLLGAILFQPNDGSPPVLDLAPARTHHGLHWTRFRSGVSGRKPLRRVSAQILTSTLWPWNYHALPLRLDCLGPLILSHGSSTYVHVTVVGFAPTKILLMLYGMSITGRTSLELLQSHNPLVVPSHLYSPPLPPS